MLLLEAATDGKTAVRDWLPIIVVAEAAMRARAKSRSAGSERIDELRGLLHDAQSRLRRTVATTDDELTSLAAAQDTGGFIESSGRGVAEDLLSRLEGRERHELDEIRAAQGRLETGAFGVCEKCQRPIPVPRLRAVPWTRACVTCQSREETE
jgi:RNA polymerase-binding transcription factor DksA